MSAMTSTATTIVCATDLSESSRKALDTTIELAALYAPAAVRILHIHEVPERIENLQELANDWEERRAALHLAIDEEIARSRTMRPDLTLDVRGEVVSGKPYREILKYVLQVGAKIVVVGTHGHTGFKHTLLGSVAERIVRKAPCTVVVAKPLDVCEHLAARLGGSGRRPRSHRIARRWRVAGGPS